MFDEELFGYKEPTTPPPVTTKVLVGALQAELADLKE